jgi:thiamine-monophosphate kinase
VGPGDDAAVLAGGTAVTVDTLVEGVHWNERLSPADVGFKTLAVSVSDLAAMGATPRWALLALSLPVPLDRAWVEQFAAGFGAACARWEVALVGGDTTRSVGARVVAATVGGESPQAPMRRTGARPGDDLWVTGTLGLAGAGWAWPDPPASALAALRRPDPPLAFARDLPALATAAMDLSDGLGQDLPRLCAASGVGARVERAALPAHPDLGPEPWAIQLGGGEDYQLLFSAPPARRTEIVRLALHHGRVATRIGAVTEATAIALDGDAWPATGFRHFPEAA